METLHGARPAWGGGGGSRSALPVEGREVATNRPLDWTREAAGLTYPDIHIQRAHMSHDVIPPAAERTAALCFSERATELGVSRLSYTFNVIRLRVRQEETFRLTRTNHLCYSSVCDRVRDAMSQTPCTRGQSPCSSELRRHVPLLSHHVPCPYAYLSSLPILAVVYRGSDPRGSTEF